MALNMQFGKVKKLKSTKGHTTLPIGPTARVAFEIDAARAACCRVAELLLSREPVNHAELEECARLDEALARAHRLPEATPRGNNPSPGGGVGARALVEKKNGANQLTHRVAMPDMDGDNKSYDT